MHEIIHIVDPAVLSADVRGHLEIEAVKDHPLEAGYYFVLWPTARQRHQGKRYFGPFPTCAEARLLQRSALALQLIEDGMRISPEIVACRSIVRPITATLYPAAYREHAAGFSSMAAMAA